MPYIKLEDRTKFSSAIKIALSIMLEGTESQYIRGEFFGFFVNRLVRKHQGDNSFNGNFFNSLFFNEEKKKALSNSADKIAAMINRADPIGSAGELNYVISAVYWGFLGCAPEAQEASYGMRAYLTGILEKIYSSLQPDNNGSQRDATMAFRRHLVVRGVLHDVLSEAYRRKTSCYEDEKRMDNRDIWSETRELILPPSDE